MSLSFFKTFLTPNLSYYTKALTYKIMNLSKAQKSVLTILMRALGVATVANLWRPIVNQWWNTLFPRRACFVEQSDEASIEHPPVEQSEGEDSDESIWDPRSQPYVVGWESIKPPLIQPPHLTPMKPIPMKPKECSPVEPEGEAKKFSLKHVCFDKKNKSLFFFKNSAPKALVPEAKKAAEFFRLTMVHAAAEEAAAVEYRLSIRGKIARCMGF